MWKRLHVLSTPSPWHLHRESCTGRDGSFRPTPCSTACWHQHWPVGVLERVRGEQDHGQTPHPLYSVHSSSTSDEETCPGRPSKGPRLVLNSWTRGILVHMSQTQMDLRTNTQATSGSSKSLGAPLSTPLTQGDGMAGQRQPHHVSGKSTVYPELEG